MDDPAKVLKDQRRDDRRREKLKIKLEKRYQTGKMSKEEYMEELHKIGYVTQQELLDDFRQMIREEIEYLESLEGTDNGETGGSGAPPPVDARSLYGSELNDENLGGPDSDQMPLDYGEDGSLPRPPPPPPPPPPEDYMDEDEEEYEEIPAEMAEWDFDEGDEDEDEDYDEDEDEYDDDEDYEEDEDEGEDEAPGKPFTDFVKVDQRSGVVDYSDIKMFDGTGAKIMDSYDTATKLGAERKKKRKRRRERPSKKEEIPPEPELTEAEKLIMEMEADTEDEPLDLGEVLIPDMVSTMESEKGTGKRKKVLAEIMWEADEEDRVWLQNKFLEEIDALKVRLRERREAEAKAKAEALESADIDDWDIEKVSSKVVKVKKAGKVRKIRREIWKVVEKLDDDSGERREEKTRDESEGTDASIKEEKRERRKERKAVKKEDKPKEEKKVEKKERKSVKKAEKGKKKEEKVKGKKPKGKKKNADVDWD